MFDLKIAFLFWTIFQLLILFFCLYLIQIPQTNFKIYYVDSISKLLFFLPVLHELYIGQASLLFGILPVLIGYYYWLRNSNIKAGLAWSLAILKPQFIFIPFFIMINYIFNLKSSRIGWKIFLGFSLGLGLIIVLNFLLFGQALLEQWFHSITLSPATDYNYGYHKFYPLFVSLPSSGYFIFKHIKHFLIWQNLFSIVVLLINLFLSIQFLSKYDFSDFKTKMYLFTIANLAINIIIPHIMYYDLILYGLNFIIFGYFFQINNSKDNQKLYNLLKLGFVSINLYGVLYIINQHLGQPIFLMLFLIVIYILFLKIVYSYESGR